MGKVLYTTGNNRKHLGKKIIWGEHLRLAIVGSRQVNGGTLRNIKG